MLELQARVKQTAQAAACQRGMMAKHCCKYRLLALLIYLANSETIWSNIEQVVLDQDYDRQCGAEATVRNILLQPSCSDRTPASHDGQLRSDSNACAAAVPTKWRAACLS
jgi:hypothetical protein